MDIIFSATIANFSEFKNDRFLTRVMDKTNDVEFYRYQPRPGTIHAASKDWKAIGNISAFLSIVSFAWQIYSDFIAPKKTPDSNSGIIIRIENMGHHNNFWLGHDILTEEQLMQKVLMALEDLKGDTQAIQKEVDSLRNSMLWQPVKKNSIEHNTQ
jgi:hypothetical protein